MKIKKITRNVNYVLINVMNVTTIQIGVILVPVKEKMLQIVLVLQDNMMTEKALVAKTVLMNVLNVMPLNVLNVVEIEK